MLAKLATELQTVILAMKSNLFLSLKIVGALWIFHIINFSTKYSLNVLGIKTRKAEGLPGIVLSPLLHADFNHLFFNTIPLFVLTDLMLLDGTPVFLRVTFAIVVLNGTLIWAFGQKGIHIGASGLIMGYLGYLLAKAYFNITGTTIILAGVCLYYFGGLLLSIFPGAKKNISWDGHLFGLISGIGVAYFLPKILTFFPFLT